LPDDTGPEVLPDDTAPDDTAPDDTADTEDTETWTPVTFEHLPVLRIAADGPIGDTEKTPGLLEVIEEHAGTHEDLDTAPRAYVVSIGIEIHGSSSTGYPKLGYKLECRNGAGEDDDCALVGLPEGSDWVLHAPYSDKTYMRNALAYGLGRDAADASGRWEPRAQHVELYLDGEYRGIYLLVERVSRETDRLDIPKTTLEDGTVAGGFIVKVDQHRSAGFDTAVGTPLDWVSPKTDKVTAEEAAYLLAWFDQMEAALAADTWADPVVGYPAWLDVDAWVDHWLLNELTHNIDAYRLSAYLWVDGPPGAAKLRAGPLWDFDRAWGNRNYCDTWNTYGWIVDDLTTC
ncbi:MAG: CotH kinase family protein, partial [Myxococcota bacterium]